MVSVKIIAAAVAILTISYSCDWTKAQELESENDGSNFQGSGSVRSPGRPNRPPGSDFLQENRFPRRSGSGLEDRQESDSSEESGEEENVNQRFFFGSFGGAGQQVSCDFNTQAGASCASCNQVLFCSRNGGRLKTCRGFLRYCTDGRCTFRQSDACAAAAATTTVATTTGADSTTTESATTTQAPETTTGSG